MADPEGTLGGPVHWPLTMAAVLFLAAYAWPILEPGLPEPWLGTCRTTTVVAWLRLVTLL